MKRGIVLSFILVTWWSITCCTAQTALVDSLKQRQIHRTDTADVNTLTSISVAYLNLDETDSAFRYALLAKNLAAELDFRRGLAYAHSILANIYFYQGNYSASLANNLEALRIKEELNDRKGIANCYNNIGNVYLQLDNLEESRKNHSAALEIRKSMNDTVGLSYSYNNLGNVYRKSKMYDDALRSHFECLKIRKAHGDVGGMGTSYANIGIVYTDLGKYREAQHYLEDALHIHDSIDDKEGVEIAYVNLASVYLGLKAYDSAEMVGVRALKLATEIDDVETIMEASLVLSTICKRTGRFEEALQYYTAYVDMRDSIYNEEGIKDVVQTQMQYQFEKEQAENNAIVMAEKMKNRTILVFVSSFLFLSLVFGFIVYRNYRRKQKVNEIITRQKLEVEQQNRIIEEKNADITASIKYAKRIQEAILPSMSAVKEKFPDSFVLYRPKDIVAGDFYWVSDAVTKYQEKFVMAAVADCTGHGVPGALMSIIGNNFLRLCEVEPTVNRPSEALDFINAGISRTLRQEYNNSEIKDGMDMVFIAIDYHSHILHFAGAKNPIYIVRNGELTEYKGDRHPVGSYVGEAMKKFTNHSIPVQKGDCVYLFSDGYADQFGGPNGKKFMYSRFKELLAANSHLPMEQQQEVLVREFEAWIGSREQVDDVCVFGLKVQ